MDANGQTRSLVQMHIGPVVAYVWFGQGLAQLCVNMAMETKNAKNLTQKYLRLFYSITGL